MLLDCSPEALTFLPQDTEALDELYSRFEFTTRLKALRAGAEKAITDTASDEGEVSDEFAGGLVDDSDVEVVDDEHDGCSFERTAEADVMHPASSAE